MYYHHINISSNDIRPIPCDKEIEYCDFTWNNEFYVRDPWQKRAEQVLYKTFRLNFIDSLIKIKTHEIYYYRINENEFYFDGKPTFYVFLDKKKFPSGTGIYQFRFTGNCSGYRLYDN